MFTVMGSQHRWAIAHTGSPPLQRLLYSCLIYLLG